MPSCARHQGAEQQEHLVLYGLSLRNLVKNPEQLELLRQIDVLVDGPFVQALRDEDLFFRGSSNQRIINVQKSLKEGRVIELNLTTENPNPVL